MTTNRPRCQLWLGMTCLGLVASLALAACGSSGSSTSSEASTGGSSSSSAGGNSPMLVTINKLGTLAYFIDLAHGFESKSSDLGAQSRAVDVELESEKAITELQNAISSGAEGIAIDVPDQKLGPRVMEIARQANVPLLATNDTIENSEGEEAPFVGYDNTNMGEQVGQSAAEQLNEKGWVKEGKDVGILSVEVQTLSVCQDRNVAATKAVLSEVPGTEESDVIHVPYDGSPEDALKAVPPVITAHPEVERWVVYACNDEGVSGALHALEQAGVSTADEIGVGLGANIACEEWKLGRPTGFTSALWLNGEDVGATSAEELYKAATEGAEIPKKKFAPVQIVTAKNYKQVGVKC